MRALVTGGGGFVGSNLVRRLISEGHEVIVILRYPDNAWRLSAVMDKLTVREGSIADKALVAEVFNETKPQWVFHCAAHGAYSFEHDVGSMLRTNVVGLGNLLEAASERGCELFVNSGSSSEYGDVDHPPTEEELPVPNSIYAITKVAATQLCGRFAVEYGLKTCTLRLYSAFGPWEDPRRIMPTMCRAAIDHKLPPLAAPWVVRDFIYIDDIIDAYMRTTVADVAPGSIYNIGTGSQLTLTELADLFMQMFDIHDAPEFGAYETRNWDTKCWVAAPEKAKRELGWSSTTSVRDGITKFVAWIEAQQPSYDLSLVGSA